MTVLTKQVVALAQVIDDAILITSFGQRILLPTILYTKQIDTHICTAKMKSHYLNVVLKCELIMTTQSL
jgi:hypothetical protein